MLPPSLCAAAAVLSRQSRRDPGAACLCLRCRRIAKNAQNRAKEDVKKLEQRRDELAKGAAAGRVGKTKEAPTGDKRGHAKKKVRTA